LPNGLPEWLRAEYLGLPPPVTGPLCNRSNSGWSIRASRRDGPSSKCRAGPAGLRNYHSLPVHRIARTLGEAKGIAVRPPTFIFHPDSAAMLSPRPLKAIRASIARLATRGDSRPAPL